jgi:hypothetical protein
MSSFGSAVFLKRLQCFQIHLTCLSEVGQILVPVYLLSPRLNARKSCFRGKIEKYNDVRKPDRLEVKQIVEFVD